MDRLTKNLLFPELIVLVSLSTVILQWVILFRIGGLTFKPVHLTLLLLIIYFVISDSFRKILIAFIRQNRVFILVYLIFLLIALISIFWGSSGIGPALVKIFKYVTYFITFILFSGVIHIILESKKQHVFVKGALLGTAVFFVYGYIVFDQIGRSFFLEYIGSFLAGDSSAIMFNFYKTLFNNTSDGANAETVATNLRNTMMGCFILFLLFCLIFRVNGIILNWLKRLLIVVCAFMVVSSVSRSNMLILTLIICYGILIKFLKSGVPVKYSAFQILIVFLTLSVLSIYSMDIINILAPAAEMISSRIGQLSEDARLEAFSVVSNNLNENWLLGNGFDAPLSLFKKEVDNHNLILGAWYQYGLLGLFFSLGLYFVLSLDHAVHLTNYFRSDSYWKLNCSFPWTMTLIISPVFRTMVAGDHGNLTMIDWVFFSFYFGLSFFNQWTSSKKMPQLI